MLGDEGRHIGDQKIAVAGKVSRLGMSEMSIQMPITCQEGLTGQNGSGSRIRVGLQSRRGLLYTVKIGRITDDTNTSGRKL